MSLILAAPVVLGALVALWAMADLVPARPRDRHAR